MVNKTENVIFFSSSEWRWSKAQNFSWNLVKRHECTKLKTNEVCHGQCGQEKGNHQTCNQINSVPIHGCGNFYTFHVDFYWGTFPAFLQELLLFLFKSESFVHF